MSLRKKISEPKRASERGSLLILPPLAVVAKSAYVPEINAGKLVCALGTWPAATVNVAS